MIGPPLIPHTQVPILGMELIPDTDRSFSDPVEGYWTDPSANDDNPPFCLGKVLRVNRYEGTVQVIGIDCDFNVTIPLTSSQASGGFHGDVSLPARGWQVIMGRLRNGDLYPIKYLRPYDRDEGWMRGVPLEMDEGDIGWTTERSKFIMFQNGMIHTESSPNCLRQMHPLSGGDKIQDICRTYGLFTDAGSIAADLYDNSPGLASFVKIEASKDFGSEPSVDAEAVFGSFDATGAKYGIKLSVKNGGPVMQMTNTGEAFISAKKLTLGAETSSEPVVLGASFLAEYKAFKAAYNAHVSTYNLHVHPETGATTSPTPSLGSAFSGNDDFLSSSVFSK